VRFRERRRRWTREGEREREEEEEEEESFIIASFCRTLECVLLLQNVFSYIAHTYLKSS